MRWAISLSFCPIAFSTLHGDNFTVGESRINKIENTSSVHNHRPSDRPESTLGLLSVAATDDNNTDINITITIATLIRTQTDAQIQIHSYSNSYRYRYKFQMHANAYAKRNVDRSQRRRRRRRRLRAPDVHQCTFEHELVADGYSQPARELLIRMPLLSALAFRCNRARAGRERDNAMRSLSNQNGNGLVQRQAGSVRRRRSTATPSEPCYWRWWCRLYRSNAHTHAHHQRTRTHTRALARFSAQARRENKHGNGCLEVRHLTTNQSVPCATRVFCVCVCV